MKIDSLTKCDFIYNLKGDLHLTLFKFMGTFVGWHNGASRNQRMSMAKENPIGSKPSSSPGKENTAPNGWNMP